jgi:hypothetical protein
LQKGQAAAEAFLGLACKRGRSSSGRFYGIRKQGRELFINTATTRAIVDPARIRVAAPLLGQRTFTTTEPHAHLASVEALDIAETEVPAAQGMAEYRSGFRIDADASGDVEGHT